MEMELTRLQSLTLMVLQQLQQCVMENHQNLKSSTIKMDHTLLKLPEQMEKKKLLQSLMENHQKPKWLIMEMELIH